MITTVDINKDIINQLDKIREENKFKFRSRTQAINYFLMKGITEYSSDQAVIKFFKKMLGE